MKNVTLSADADLIAKARSIARAQGKTLNTVFEEWLLEFTAGEADQRSSDGLMKSLKHVDAGRHFHREELNER